MTGEQITGKREILLVSDFDQTLSYNDSGIVLCEMLDILGFQERVDGLSKIHLIQQGGELPYLLLHDPEFRRVRKEHLAAVGKRIRLKANIGYLLQLLDQIDDYHFTFHVVSAAPEEVIQSALEGIIPAENIHGTQFRYDPAIGEIQSIIRVPAGYGKVAVVEDLRAHLRTLPNGPRRAATQWRKLESYRALLPAESPEYLKELFCSNVRAMLEILEKEPSTEQAAG